MQCLQPHLPLQWPPSPQSKVPESISALHTRMRQWKTVQGYSRAHRPRLIWLSSGKCDLCKVRRLVSQALIRLAWLSPSVNRCLQSQWRGESAISFKGDKVTARSKSSLARKELLSSDFGGSKLSDNRFARNQARIQRPNSCSWVAVERSGLKALGAD